jgi:hypothetical protein
LDRINGLGGGDTTDQQTHQNSHAKKMLFHPSGLLRAMKVNSCFAFNANGRVKNMDL